MPAPAHADKAHTYTHTLTSHEEVLRQGSDSQVAGKEMLDAMYGKGLVGTLLSSTWLTQKKILQVLEAVRVYSLSAALHPPALPDRGGSYTGPGLSLYIYGCPPATVCLHALPVLLASSFIALLRLQTQDCKSALCEYLGCGLGGVR